MQTAQPRSSPQVPLTSSKMRFLARVIAELRALIQDSFSSGLTARKIRLGAYRRENSGQCRCLSSDGGGFTLSLPTEG